MSAEKRTADAILEKPYPVVIGGVTYNVAPPSVATLIEVSAEVARLPQYGIDPKKTTVEESLRIAKDCEPIGNILAILILGAKRLTKKRLFRTIDAKAKLSRKILLELRPKEIQKLTASLLGTMETSFFFQTFIFLQEINLTKPTIVIPSGQLSEE